MPKLYFPECYSSENSKELNDILNSKASIQISIINKPFNIPKKILKYTIRLILIKRTVIW